MPDREIQIVVNGKPVRIADNSSVSQLLAQLEIRHRAVAVELNAELLTNRSFSGSLLSEGDTLEIVSLVGGG